MQDIPDVSQYRSQQQLSRPFRISNRGLDTIDRFLTFKNTQTSNLTARLVQLDSLSKDQTAQLWSITRSQVSPQLNYIQHKESGLFLSLHKGQHIDQYLVELAEKRDNKSEVSQLWSFGLGENLRQTIKIEPKAGTIYYLQYNPDAVKGGNNNFFVCRPQSSERHRYHRNWKLSPYKQELVLPSCSKEQFSLELDIKLQIDLIKCFSGKIYHRKSPRYSKVIQQYATSSYPKQQMEPFLVAYPNDIQDIRCMIKFAGEKNKKIVARSGGHQYCGLSSGGDGTIVLSMDEFSGAVLREDGIVEVGPCTRLKDAAKQFNEWGLTTPHGQCPLVNIGGHGQTGGFGYFIRSFGLFIDHIIAFDLVLANGQHRKVTRPELNAPVNTEEERLNLQLYRGVLGGNAGSFGIITKYYLKLIKNSDHPKSYGFSKIRLFNKDLFISIMKYWKQWTQIIANDKNNTELKGLDLEFTVGEVYIELVNFKMPVLILEGVYSDPNGGVPYNNQFKSIYDKFMEGQSFFEKTINFFMKRWEGQYLLSELNYKHVRQFPMMTLSGRQFDLPYQKRCNITMSSLTDQFIQSFADQVAQVVNRKKKSVLANIQMSCGGGAFRINGQKIVDGLTLTSIPHRQSVYFFNYDIFYNTDNDPNARNEAIALQQRMQSTIEQCFNTKEVGEKRFLWASFGNVNMLEDSVIDMYYDSREQYEQLQQLKKKVDKDNIFSSPMTVKPPQ